MESEKIKEEDPFLPATPAFSDAVDFAPARNHQDGTKLIAMSSVSEEETQEKEDSSFSPDLALLFVVEEQIWGRLSNSVQKEDPEGLEGSQQDPETWSEPSEGERNPCIQEARNTAFHLGQHGAVSSLSIHQSSLVNAITPAQVPSSPSEVAMGQVEAQVLSAGFPPALDLYDTFSEAQGEQAIETKSVAAQKESDYECLPVSHDISKCHQYTESFEAPSSVNHSWERDTRQEMSEGILESMQAVWDTKMHPHTEGADQMEEQKVREFQEEREDEEFSAPSQSRPGSSEDRRIDADTTETEPGGILSFISSKIVDNCLDREEMAEGLVEISNSAILHFLDKEEDDEEKNRAPSLKEITKTTGAERHIDCGESEANQNEFLQKVGPESAETEALDLGDKGWSRKEEILDWKGMENKMGENDKPELEHDAWEGQQQDMEVEEASREKAQRKMETAPVTLGPDTLSNLTNNVASPDVNQNSSLTKGEGFAVSLEQVYPSSHCTESTSGLLESCVQATGMPFAKTSSEGLIPKTKPPVSPDPRPLEDSGMYDKGDHPSQSSHNEKHPTTEDRKYSFEIEVIQSSEDEKSAKGTDGEGMAVSTGDLVLPSDPEDLYDPQLEDEPVDVETHLLPTSPVIPKAPSVQQVNVSKGPSDGSSGNALLCEKSDALQETPNQNLPGSCHMDLVVNDEDSAVDSDMTMHDSSKESSFIEDVQNSASTSLQNIPLGEELCDTVQKTIELGHDLPCATQYLVSFHKKDTTAHSFEKSYQHQDAPIGSFVFPGKDTGADTPYMEQQPSNHESGCFSDCGQNGTEDYPSTDSPTSLDVPCAIATDVTQLTKPLTSVPILEQTLAFEHTTTHLGQLALLDSDYRQSVQPSAHPHNTNVLAHPVTPHDLHPKHPTHHEEQLSSSSETSQFLGPIMSLQSSTPSLDAADFEQPTSPECDLSQDSQAPESLLSSNEPLSLGCAANQGAPMPMVLKKATICSLPATCIASQPVQLVQLSKSSQSWECIASESNKRLSTEDPDLTGALNKDTDCPYLTSSSSSPLSLDANQSVQHAVGAPIPNPPIDCTEGDNWTHGSVPVANLVSQMTPSVHGSTSPSQLHNMESSVEEPSVVQLAKSEGTGVPRDLEVGHLGTHSDSVTIGNDTFAANNFFSCISETISRDTHDGKCSDLTLHHLVESQKRCEVTESQNSKPAPLLLAFTNPIHFLQPGPPSPPTTRHPQKQQAEPREPLWWQATAETAAEDTTVPMGSQRAVEDTGRFRVDLGTPVMEPSPAVVPRKDRAAKHLPLEKSSSCPYKNVAGSDTKGSTSNSKKQEEERIKYRTKSKDWHRQGVRKTSIPTESVLEGIASLVSSKEYASAQKDKTEHFDRVKYGERTAAATVENFKRRHSKLINSSRLLYQEYSDVALNKAIQNQKRDSLSEEVEPGTSPDSPRLRRKALTSQDSYLQRLSVSSSVSLWQDIPMVRGSTMLLSMTREEQKLQEAKFELIASEASYLRSLNIAVDHFQHSQELQAVLSNQDRQWLFSRLQDVRDVSANFLFDLEEKLEENMFTFNVCDVALRHAPEFRRVYLPYVTNQTYQEQTFQRLMNGVPAFQQVLEKLESDPVCQRLSLKSFLILPFQRITRLKLLLQNILKRTHPGAEEEIQATQAYDALEKLIKDCNENVQRMKSTEELIYLSKNMAFECKIFPLISQSRRLVKHGELTALEYNPGLKWKLTTRSIYLHLFNDYLLLSRPRENGRFIVFDYAASSDVRGEKCEMKLHGTNKNVFRLFLLHNHQGKKVEFLFRTETQSEKLRWISALSPQQIDLDFLDDPDALQVQGVKSYKPRENDELALEKADIIMVQAQSSDGWLEGVRLSDGERGWFPLDHVDFISSKQVRQMNLKEEQRVKKAKQQVFHKK